MKKCLFIFVTILCIVETLHAQSQFTSAFNKSRIAASEKTITNLNNYTDLDSLIKVMEKSKDIDIITNDLPNDIYIDRSEILARKLLNIPKNEIINPNSAFHFRTFCEEKIKKLNKEINIIKEKSDTAAMNLLADSLKEYNKQRNDIEESKQQWEEALAFFKAVNRLDGIPKLKNRFHPVTSIIAARRFFYDATDSRKSLVFINNSVIQSNFNDNHKISTEVLSGVFPLFSKRVPIKFSLGTTVNQNSDTSNLDKAVSKILSGGLIRPSFTYPAFFSHSRFIGNSSIIAYIPIEIATNFDGVKSTSQPINNLFNFTEISAALNFSVTLSQAKTNENEATLFINGRLSYIDGGSKFYDAIPGDRKVFWLSQINFGLKVIDKYTIAINIPAWSSNTSLLSERQSTIAFIID